VLCVGQIGVGLWECVYALCGTVWSVSGDSDSVLCVGKFGAGLRVNFLLCVGEFEAGLGE